MMLTNTFPNLITLTGERKVRNVAKKFDGASPDVKTTKASSGTKGMPPKAKPKNTGKPTRSMY